MIIPKEVSIFQPSAKALHIHGKVKKFMEDLVYPAEKVMICQLRIIVQVEALSGTSAGVAGHLPCSVPCARLLSYPSGPGYSKSNQPNAGLVKFFILTYYPARGPCLTLPISVDISLQTAIISDGAVVC